MTNPRIPVLVIAGYLGAGKTTLVNRMLANATQPIAVVVNDFGAVNIDAALIASRHADTIELTNGCVCCVVGGSLADVLIDIDARTTRPGAVIVEASGVADPAAVASYAHLGGFRLAGTIVLVDAANALATDSDRLLQMTFRRQVSCADVVVITKGDLVNDDDMAAVRSLVAAHADHAPVVDSRSADLAELFDIASPSNRLPAASPHARFSARMIETPPSMSRGTLDQLLDALPDSTVRAKGVVALGDGQRVLVQRVGRHTSVIPTELDPTGLVAITVG